MTSSPQSDLPSVPAHHLARVNTLLAHGRRKLLGLVGAPGAGKSTLATALQRAFAGVSQVDEAMRTDRLVQRHQRFGRSAQAARAWVAGTDEPNARPIAATRARAQHLFRWS